MAYGQVVSIPTGTHQQEYVPSGASYPGITILNPNDGVIFVSVNADCLGTNVGQWDYKIPSQSYAALPGPFLSVGLYYLDQSGSGAPGQVNLYPTPNTPPIPWFQAIGRAIQTVGSTLDITEGSQPAAPGAGILRLWADGTNSLNLLGGDDVNHHVVDSVNYASVITSLSSLVITNNLGVGGAISSGRVTITGSGNTSATYSFQCLDSTRGVNNFYVRDDGFIYLGHGVTIDPVLTMSGITTLNCGTGNFAAVVSSGSIQSTGGAVGAGTNVAAAVGDLWSNRGSAAGYVWLGNTATHYVGFDGTNYQFPTSPVNIASNLTVGGSIVATGAITTGGILSTTAGQINLGTSDFILNVGGAIRYAATGVHSFEAVAGGFQNVQCASINVNGNIVATGSLTFNASFSGGSIVASGGSHVADWLVVVNGNVYRIQLWQ